MELAKIQLVTRLLPNLMIFLNEPSKLLGLKSSFSKVRSLSLSNKSNICLGQEIESAAPKREETSYYRVKVVLQGKVTQIQPATEMSGILNSKTAVSA